MSTERKAYMSTSDRASRAGSSAASAHVPRLATNGRYAPRTRLLLEAPITMTLLLKLAAPNVVVMVAQASVGLIETYFTGKLGTDALAGVALVFPLVMLMQMMSGGAMGGGILSAVARALGAGRRNDADALSFHALAIGVIFGLVFMLGALIGGPSLYVTMGGSGPSLAAALTYSNVIFSCAILVWVFNSLANVKTVGPLYGLFGLGLALYFASQGAGRLLWPLLANIVRLLIAAGGGWLALRWGGNLTHVLVAQGVALAAFGLINAAAVAGGVWFSDAASASWWRPAAVPVGVLK
jgi:MatE